MTMGNFSFSVIWSEEDSEYVGLCAEFPSLSYLDKTQETALSGIRNLVERKPLPMKRDRNPRKGYFALFVSPICGS